MKRFAILFLLLFSLSAQAAYLPSNNGAVDSGNSSTTLLTNGSTFTGTWIDVSGYSHLSVAVKTDQSGYFSVQYSPDASNVDSTLTRYYRTTGIEAPHVFVNARRYARVVFTNDSGTDQTYLRLQTMLGQRGQLNAPLDSTLSRDFDATVVRPTDHKTEVALGRRQGATLWNKFGYNSDIDTTTDPELLASWGGSLQYLTSGETIDVVSSSTSDDGDPAGTGAQQVTIWGVDENWDVQIEVVTLDGTTTVTTSSQWIGINRMSVSLAGSSKLNAGDITVTATTSGYTMAVMPITEGTTQQCIFYVPRNHQWLAGWLLFDALKYGGGSTPEVKLTAWVYSHVSGAQYEVYRGAIDTAATTVLQLTPAYPFVVGEKSIFWLTGEVSANDTEVKCRVSGELYEDPDGA